MRHGVGLHIYKDGRPSRRAEYIDGGFVRWLDPEVHVKEEVKEYGPVESEKSDSNKVPKS